MSTRAQSSGLGNSMSDALYPRNLNHAFVVHEVVHGGCCVHRDNTSVSATKPS
jgi:hypothetical protein